MYGNFCKSNGKKPKKKERGQNEGGKEEEEVEWTFDLIEELGIGRLGMTYKELYDLIPRVFWNAVDGYWDNQETMDRKQWERIRWQTCCLINVQLPRGKQLSQQKLIKFHWEIDEKSNKTDTYDEAKKQYDKFESIKKLNKKK